MQVKYPLVRPDTAPGTFGVDTVPTVLHWPDRVQPWNVTETATNDAGERVVTITRFLEPKDEPWRACWWLHFEGDKYRLELGPFMRDDARRAAEAEARRRGLT